MNEEARERRLDAELAGTKFTQEPAHRVHGLVKLWYRAGWDGARTFSAEDVERVARTLYEFEWETAKVRPWGKEPEESRAFWYRCARAALAAIGTVEEAQFRGTRCGECGMFSDWHQPRCPQYPPTRAGHGRGGAVMAQTFDPATHSAIDDILGHVANEGFEGWATYWDDHRVFGDRIVSLLLEWLEFVKSHTEAGE